MTLLALAVCLVIPPSVALLPALAGARFVTVLGTAAVAAFAVWCVVFLWVVGPGDSDTGPLGLILIPLYTVIHAVFSLAIVGVPWAIATGRRSTN